MYIPLEEQSTDSQLNKFLFGEEYENIIDYDNIMDNSYTKFNIFSLNKNEDGDEDEESKNYKILPLKEKPDLSKKNENIILDINYISNKEKEKSENNINKIENSSDKKETNNIKKHKIFKCSSNPCSNINTSNSPSKRNFRVDNTKRLYKVAISKFATEKINNLIEESKLPKRLKKKIHVPNSILFTSNVKELDNKEFLDYDLKKVFTLGKNDYKYQCINEKNISKILKYKTPEKTEKIKKFLTSTYENIIKDFYGSQKFEEFITKDKIKFFTERFEKEKNISLFEKNGLIKLFRMTQKKRKREGICHN